MKVMFILFAVAAVLELSVFTVPFLWRWRKVFVILCLVLSAFTTGIIATWRPNTLGVLFFLASLYRIVNLIRLYKGRMHERYLRHATSRTSLTLIATQLFLAGAWWEWYQNPVNRQVLWLVIAIAQTFVAIIFVTSAIRRMRRTRPALSSTPHSLAQLPSITIAIPARNETDDLRQCLQSIIANDYPKF